MQYIVTFRIPEDVACLEGNAGCSVYGREHSNLWEADTDELLYAELRYMQEYGAKVLRIERVGEPIRPLADEQIHEEFIEAWYAYEGSN